MLRNLRGSRARVAYVHDVVMAGASFIAAQYLRLGDAVLWYADAYLWIGAALFAGVAAVVFAWMDLYRGVWRYASLNDMVSIFKAATLVILIFLPLLFLIQRLETLPRSSLFINWFVLIAFLGGPRAIYRVFKDRRLDTVLTRDTHNRIPVLLAGDGDGAELFIRGVARNPDANYSAVGILSDKTRRVGRQIHGIPVLGTLEQVEQVVKRLGRSGKRPRRIIITKKDLPGPQVRALLDEAGRLGLTLARLPRLTDFEAEEGQDRLTVRPIAIEDLLGRPQAVLDRPAMQAMIDGRRVLVTGAGGTIGSELVRQISDFGPAHLTLLDHGEYQLYEIDRELAGRHPDLPRTSILRDVRDRDRTRAAVAEARPDIVFHAAALKHVPIVEAQPNEGVLTNIIGTRNVADACRETGVGAMVLISTDKAVNPSSVMGASKRLAESYCQALDLEGADTPDATRYVTVRFGNVLGSTGSVVPLFHKQLEAGGPITVTHPDVSRYFMTVREAVELVLQASVYGSGDRDRSGKIFVLEMGEPVRIAELAEQMIRLAGLEPGKDVDIVFTGLRPGEKLHEELLHESEPVISTAHPDIMLAGPRTADRAVLARAIDELGESARTGDVQASTEALKRLVPDYRPTPVVPATAPAARSRRVG